MPTKLPSVRKATECETRRGSRIRRSDHSCLRNHLTVHVRPPYLGCDLPRAYNNRVSLLLPRAFVTYEVRKQRAVCRMRFRLGLLVEVCNRRKAHCTHVLVKLHQLPLLHMLTPINFLDDHAAAQYTRVVHTYCRLA